MKQLLMIAARMPTPGETKTRLGQAIGMDHAADLYCAFLRDLALEFDCEAGQDWDLAWTYSPPEADFRTTLADLTDAPTTAQYFLAQDGADWGTRQENLMRAGFAQGYERVVLMASDSPQLTRANIADAFSVLESAEVVIGRVLDGGYYLIGMAGFRDVLRGVPMSTASAADGIVEKTETLGLRIGEVAPTFDVDIADDLEQLRNFLDHHPNRCLHTRKVLIG